MLDRIRSASAAAIVLAAALVCPALAQPQDADSRARMEERREAWQRVPEIFDAMAVRPGAVVADVGAGGGFFTARLARTVGTSGRVYAVDVSSRVVEQLKTRVADERLRNVEVVQGEPDDPRLPPATLDAALIVNSYHEMAEHQAMLAKLKAALKPGGRLVIIEPISESARDETREQQTAKHEIGAQYAQDDAQRAGFRVVRLEDPFTERRHDGGSNDIEWLLVLTPAPARAAAAPPSQSAIADTKNAEWKAPELRISVDDFKALWTKEAALVLDVRDPESYRRGHLPGAVLRTPEALATGGAEQLRSETRPIVTYCS